MIKIGVAIIGLVVGCAISSILTAYLISEHHEEK